VVSTDRLIDGLWGERPPATASHSIQVYISQLKKILNRAGDDEQVLVTRAPGYMIQIGQGQLDADCFDRLVEEAGRGREDGDPAAAAAKLGEALELWRGPPLADFAYEPFAQREIARLEELHVVAVEDRIDADLALGRHAMVVGELDALVDEHPLRERLRGQQMVALYRSGRQAEALEAYQDARRTLVDELGIEPGPALHELERRILRQDPDLDVPPPEKPVRATTGRAPRRAGVVLIVAGLLAAAGLAAGLALTLGSSATAELTRLPPNSVGRIDPRRDGIAGATLVGSGPTLIAAGEGAVWVANFDDKTLSHIDPATGREVRRISADGTPTGLAVGAGGVWITHDFEGTMSRVDPGLDKIVTTIPLASGVNAVAVGDNAVWVVDSLRARVLRVDPTTNDLVDVIPVGGTPTGITTGAGSLWVADGQSVLRIDPRTRERRRIALRFNASQLAVGAGAVWVTNGLGDSVTKIDIRTNAADRAIPVGDDPAGIAVGKSAVWVANSLGGTVMRIDPAMGRVVQTIVVGNAPSGVAVARGTVWVTAPSR
jgi:YVTN family beta-propeller protein